MTRRLTRRSLLPSPQQQHVQIMRGFAAAAEDDGMTINIDKDVPIRNIAIIAHVDHGKTTLVDCLLTEAEANHSAVQGGASEDPSAEVEMSGDRVMDSGDLEKERGITILSKCTSISYHQPTTGQEYLVNIVDTPGHADFGGEVERIMNMVDGVALVVCAIEGPMAQTRFVLQKALQAGLKPFVVINKVDRPNAPENVTNVEDAVFDLFDALGATDEQLDFPILYASGVKGFAVDDMAKMKPFLEPGHDTGARMNQFFETVVDRVKAPDQDFDSPFQMLVSQVDTHPFFGTLLVGRVTSGEIAMGAMVRAVTPEGEKIEDVRLRRVLSRRGMRQVYLDKATSGNLVALAGFDAASVTATIGSPQEMCDAVPVTPIDPPTLSMVFSPNSSPFSGQEGTKLTPQAIAKRLAEEVKINLSLKVEKGESAEQFEVYGRGELQLGILMETMRREGFEFSVSAPRVVYREGAEGKEEPMEEVILDVDQQYAAACVEKMTLRKADIVDYVNDTNGSRAMLTFHIPTRGLIGFKTEFVNMTRGDGVMQQLFHGYTPYKGYISRGEKGSIISMNEGVATGYSLARLEARGTLFIKPQTKCYDGMVVGESGKATDVECNPTATKELTNIRNKGSEEQVRLTPPRQMNLEEMISYVKDDELIEVTPQSIRLRKLGLDQNTRRKHAKQAKALRDAAKRDGK
jgi:GTP-binding protein